MQSLNRAQLIGTLGRDPEIKTLPTGAKVANFSMATNERYTPKGGQPVEKTEWHRIVAWRGLADISELYLKKGSKVFVEGKLSTRSWDDQNGHKHTTTEIVADNMIMLDGKKESEPKSGQSNSSGYTPPEPEDDLPF